VVVHPIGAEVIFESGLCDALAQSLLRVWETQGMILGHEGAMDVVDGLRVLTVVQRGVQDHYSVSVYYKADLLLEGIVETVGEIVEDPREELSGEGDQEWGCHGDSKGQCEKLSGGGCMCFEVESIKSRENENEEKWAG